jgi:F-type H+-transporting ATPase subunit a
MNRLKQAYWIFALTVVFLFAPCAISYAQEHDDNTSGETTMAETENDLDLGEIIFGHLGDSYEWHITDIGDTRLALPLPVIVYSSQSGWHCFLSSRFEEAEEEHGEGADVEGLMIAHGGDHDGKIVEMVNGVQQRPLFDISITKNVMSLFINVLLLIVIILGVARWYKGKKPGDAAPKGFVGLMEMFIMSVENDIIRPCVGKDYKRYSPYLLTAFFFIFFSNLMGLVPIFPGGANLTGNIAITMVLALMTFLIVNFGANKHYWKDIFWPDVPTWLKCPVPLMPVIELFGVFTKPFALMVRLFANILAGHSIILSLVCIIFVTSKFGAAVCGGMTFVSVVLSLFMNMLELLVAYIQAYVFTMLSSVFIGMSREGGHEE